MVKSAGYIGKPAGLACMAACEPVADKAPEDHLPTQHVLEINQKKAQPDKAPLSPKALQQINNNLWGCEAMQTAAF
jgi:hypothetical protein